MQIRCRECEGRAIITTTNRLSNEFTRLYCACRTAECGHNFVMQLSYSHPLRLPSSKLDQQLVNQLRELPPERLEVLLDALRQAR